MDIRALAEQYESYIIEQRRWFHAHPELSWEEFGTTDHIQQELEKMGLEVHRPVPKRWHWGQISMPCRWRKRPACPLPARIPV